MVGALASNFLANKTSLLSYGWLRVVTLVVRSSWPTFLLTIESSIRVERFLLLIIRFSVLYKGPWGVSLGTN
jgi:hypothetical protein